MHFHPMSDNIVNFIALNKVVWTICSDSSLKLPVVAFSE